MAAMRKNGRSGQATVEYILVFVALSAAALALAFFARAAQRSSAETAELVGANVP